MTHTASGYVLAGYHFGKWMPHITLSDFKTDSNYRDAKATIPLLSAGSAADTAQLQGMVGQIIQFNTVNQHSVTLGLRVDVLPKTALKFEWQRVIPEDGSNLISPPFSGQDTFYGAAGTNNLDKVNIYTVALDLMF
jgi:hypothetical protein